MKILFLARRFYPDIGGVEKHVLELSKVLIKQGREITVVTQSDGKIDAYKGIRIIRIPKVPKNASEKLHIWNWFWKNRSLIKEADVIHAHDVYWWYWPFRFVFLSKKSFITFHGYESYPIKKSAVVIRRISAILARGNIAIGEFIKKWYGTEANYVTFGGVEVSKSKKQILNTNQESAIFIGRLDPDTGINKYIDGFVLILKKFPKFKLQIIGDGSLSKNLQKYDLLGNKNNPEKYLMNHNFAFVSGYLSILEALANKKLVFAVYDNPLKKDYLYMAPFSKFIVIVNSSQELANKVIYYLNNLKESEAKVNNGYKWAKDQSWDKIANFYLKLWELK